MIVDQKYWDDSYEKYIFKELPKNDPTKKILEKIIPNANEGQTVFELGCFPGRFLIEIGRKGYILNGCDTNRRVVEDLPNWLRKNGCKIGNFYNIDYKEYLKTYYEKYDIVCSFGFIEHFLNYEEVFWDHIKLLKNNGILIIQFPNFRGLVQYSLHKFFDLDNLNNHVIDAMNVEFYEKSIQKNFEILFSGYYGNFDFWIDDFKKKNGRVKNKLLSFLFKTKKYWNKLPNTSIYSPYGIIIAKNRINSNE